MITNKDLCTHKFHGLRKERKMETYHTFIFNIAHDITTADDFFLTSMSKRHTIVVTLTDEDIKQSDAVNVAFHKACEEYKKKLLEEQMYHENKKEEAK